MLWVRSPLEDMKYLFKFIFPFLCSGVEAKRGVEFYLQANFYPGIPTRSVLTRKISQNGSETALLLSTTTIYFALVSLKLYLILLNSIQIHDTYVPICIVGLKTTTINKLHYLKFKSAFICWRLYLKQVNYRGGNEDEDLTK